MSHRGRTIRPVQLVAMWLLIGAAVNIAVVWGLAVFMVPPGWRYHHTTGRWPTPASAETAFPFVWSRATLPAWWGRQEWVEKYTPAPSRTTLFESVGVPMRSMQMEWRVTGATSVDEYGMWKFPPAAGGPARYLPLLPLWPGFVLCTAFYALIAWALYRSPSVLRRWRRLRLGDCPTCGYSLTGLSPLAPCPECGAARDRRASAKSDR